MTAYSFELVIPTKINECFVYTDDECGSGEERVTLASRCNSFSAGFKSFKCVSCQLVALVGTSRASALIKSPTRAWQTQTKERKAMQTTQA